MPHFLSHIQASGKIQPPPPPILNEDDELLIEVERVIKHEIRSSHRRP
jgi:hypothetical protein